MPGRYKRRPRRAFGRRRKPYRRMGFKRRVYRRKQRITTSRMRGRWLSDRTLVKMVTVQEFRLTTETVIGFNMVYLIANSIADPMGSSSSTYQPTSADQWGAFYGYYYVAAAKVTIEAQNLTAAVAPRIVLVPTPSLALNGATDWDPTTFRPEENAYAQHRMINSSGGGRPLFIKGYMSTSKLFGRPGSSVEDNYMALLPTNGTGATSPSRQWFWNIAILNRDLPATAATVVLLVKLTQYVKLFDRRDDIPVSAQ